MRRITFPTDVLFMHNKSLNSFTYTYFKHEFCTICRSEDEILVVHPFSNSNICTQTFYWIKYIVKLWNAASIYLNIPILCIYTKLFYYIAYWLMFFFVYFNMRMQIYLTTIRIVVAQVVDVKGGTNIFFSLVTVVTFTKSGS